MALVLYRFHGSFLKTARPALGTREVDAVVPRVLPTVVKRIADALSDEGLVAHDVLGLRHGSRGKRVFQDKRHGVDRRANEYVEFVAPRVTDEDTMLEPQHELIASPLRYTELLLFEPIRVEVDGVAIHVAGPAMFVAQKALMRTSRSGRREDKDLVSIFDAAHLSAPRWTAERGVVERAAASNETWAKWLAKAPKLLQDEFGTPTAPGSVAVATQLRDQPDAPTTAGVSRVVGDMVAAVFAPTPG